MADWLSTNMRDRYRVVAEYDTEKNDFPRDINGNIEQSTGTYIKCANNIKVYAYGRDGHREMQLCCYIPSLGRGRNIKKKMKSCGIEFHDYDETDSEVTFRFSSNDIDKVADIVGAKTYGKGISAFSVKNLPKSDIKMPDEELQRYKDVIKKIHDGDWLIVKNINKRFMDDVLAKKLRENGKRKPFDYKSDQKSMGLVRDVKAYIYTKGLYEDYLSYLDSAIDDYYNGKQ